MAGHSYFYFAALAACVCFCPLTTEAQSYRIQGRVIDAVSTEPIPFVNIYLDGKTTGTITNLEGYFSFESPIYADSLVASSLGYELIKKPLKNAIEQTINFQMERAEVSLQEIVIRPTENPAHALLRNIIKNKPRNSNRTLENYNYESYNKVELDLYDWNRKFQDRKVMRPFQFVFERIDSITEDKPFLPVFLTETLSDYYYRSNPRQQREIIKASKQSGLESESLSQFLGSMYQEVNVYDNWLTLFYKNFTSPINDNGLTFYNYYLVDSAYIDGWWCYKMTFSPKTKGAFTFLGDMWVADSTFAVKQVSMEVSDHVNVNFIDKISVYQQFARVSDTLWMLAKDKIVVRFKMTENMIGVIGRKTASFRNFEINRPDIENFFATRVDIVVDEQAFKMDEIYWKENRHEELTLNETGVYEMVDSLKNTKAFQTWVDVFQMVATGYYPLGKIEIGPILSVYSPNVVEGHRFKFGIRTTGKMSERVRLGAYGAYGLWDKQFKYGGDILVVIKKDPRHIIGADFMNDLTLRSNSPAQFTQDNLLTGYVRRNVPQKLSYIRQGTVYYEKEWKIGYSNRISLQHRNLTPQFPFQYLAKNDNSFPDTATAIVTTEATFRARFAYREKYINSDFTRISLGTKYPTLLLWYTLGLSDIIGSEFNYHKVEMALLDNFPVNPIGRFYLTLTGGKVIGSLPYLLLNVHQGNETFFYNRYAFNMMNEFEFVTDLYAALQVRHHFEGFFLNKIPGIRKLKWREIIFANALIGTMTDENKSANALNTFIIPFPKPYTEVGFGIENIFRLFEVDVLWRLTYRDAPMIAKWGLRFGMKVEF